MHDLTHNNVTLPKNCQKVSLEQDDLLKNALPSWRSLLQSALFTILQYETEWGKLDPMS